MLHFHVASDGVSALTYETRVHKQDEEEEEIRWVTTNGVIGNIIGKLKMETSKLQLQELKNI